MEECSADGTVERRRDTHWLILVVETDRSSAHLRLRPQTTSGNSASAEYVYLAAERIVVIDCHSVSESEQLVRSVGKVVNALEI